MVRIFFLTVPGMYAFCILHDLADSILHINCSKSNYRKIMSGKSNKERIFLIGYCNEAKDKKTIIRYCRVLNIIYIILFLFIAIAFICCAFFENLRRYLTLFFIIRIFVLDLQIFCYSLLHSKHLKNGGVSWDFLK